MQPYYILPIDATPLTGPDAGRYSQMLRSLPDQLADLITDLESAKLLNSVTQQFSLTEEQRADFARFFLDMVLGFVMPADLAGALSTRLSTDKSRSLQILKEVEAYVIERTGMPLADIARSHSTPEVLELAGGQTELRYQTLNDLMKDIEDLPPDERLKFMNAMKKGNRILILKAFSQLKLGTDSSGKPVTFLQLAAREAPDFSAQDWLDFLAEHPDIAEPDIWEALVSFLGTRERIAMLFAFVQTLPAVRTLHKALIDALSRAKPSLVDYVRWSPYFAGVYHAVDGIDDARFTRFAELSRVERNHLVDPVVSENISALVRQGAVPENFGAAVAKIVFLVITGEVEPSALPELLGKRLGLGAEKGNELAARITSELMPRTVRKSQEVPSAPEPASEPVVEPPPPLPPRPGAGPNVVDLRKQP